jgi:hypothetical protein
MKMTVWCRQACAPVLTVADELPGYAQLGYPAACGTDVRVLLVNLMAFQPIPPGSLPCK